MAGAELRAITFEIVNTTPDAVNEILAASGNDLSALVVYVANEDAGIADSQVIVIREELAGSIVADKTGEFIVTGRTVAAVGTETQGSRSRATFRQRPPSTRASTRSPSAAWASMFACTSSTRKRRLPTFLAGAPRTPPSAMTLMGRWAIITSRRRRWSFRRLSARKIVLTFSSGAVAWEDVPTTSRSAPLEGVGSQRGCDWRGVGNAA